MNQGLHVTSEIGRLKQVCLHRPGEELLNLSPAHLGTYLFDDVPYLQNAQAEHDAFADTLRGQGIDVLYLEDLVAEVFDSVPGTREEFTAQYIAESGVSGRNMPRIVREKFDSIADNRAFVKKTMAGLAKDEVELPLDATMTLDSIVTAETEPNLIIQPMPNLYFTRDPFAVIGGDVALNRMYSSVRNRETIYGKYLFKYHPRFKNTTLLYRRHAQFHIEGGDVLNLNERTLAVGISQRTQAAAIDVLAQRIFWDSACKVDRILAFSIPVSRAFMHLDTVFTQVDVDKFTVYPGIVRSMQVFELTPGMAPGDVKIHEIDVPLERVLADACGVDAVTLIPCGGDDPVAAEREQWNDASNTLAVAPGKICVYDRNNVTNDLLYKAGLDLLVVSSAELSRGRGGPRCMSMPFVREDL